MSLLNLKSGPRSTFNLIPRRSQLQEDRPRNGNERILPPRKYILPRAFHITCVMQAVIGMLCVALHVVLLYLGSVLRILGYGIWTGIFFVISGAFGLQAYKERTFHWVIASVVLAVAAAVLTVALFVLGLFDVFTSWQIKCGTENSGDDEPNFHYIEAVSVGLMLLAVGQATTAIVSSVYACKTLCCRDTTVSDETEPAGQQDLIRTPLTHQQDDSLVDTSVDTLDPPPPYTASSIPPPKYSELQL